LSSWWDEHGRQNPPDRGTAGQKREVKLPLADQRVEQSPAQDEGKASAELWDKVWERQNLFAALERVERNGGAAGIDGMPVEALRPYLKEHWLEIREALDRQSYQPSPVRRVEIPKPDGGVRLLGIPTVLDRFLQQAIAQALTPLFEPRFSNHSYGFRPGRSAHQAVQQAQEYVQAGYEWVVDIDLEKFFDRVNHDVLMARVARRIGDKRLLRLIRRYLEAGIMIEGVVSPREEGTPQGGPLSPLLSNILLDDLDKELERRGHRFCRYADDCNVYVKSKAAGDRVMESIARFLGKRLRLMMNRDKSAVDRPWNRKFLGYTMTPHRRPKLKVAPGSVKRVKAHIREIVRKGRGRSLAKVIGEITPFLRGWVAYFRLSQVKNVFEEMDQWIRRKMRLILWRQWKRPRTRAKKVIRLGIDRARAYPSAYNGRGPWWNAGASHMNAAVPAKWLQHQGFMSLLAEHRRLNGLA